MAHVIKKTIRQDIVQAVGALQANGGWPAFDVPEIDLTVPQEQSHGDMATNVALQLAPLVGRPPLHIAEEIKSRLSGEYVKVQIAHPGFLNFFVTGEQLVGEVNDILEQGDTYGSANVGDGKKVIVEFISANPTGPLTLPNGRGGYLGDVLSSILQRVGYTVVREYYVNDRGNQIDVLGESVARRYLQLQGINVPFSDELYQGEYITELAQQLNLKDYKLTNMKKLEWVKDRVKKKALDLMLQEIQRVVEEKMQIHYDVWFSEQSLYKDGTVDLMTQQLEQHGSLYEKDGAIWLRTSAFGDDKDRVLVKSTGEGAYIQGDVSLFYDRALRRRAHKVILIVGADHHGYEKRLKALPKLLGTETKFDLIFTQMATLTTQGKEVRMSKRKGNFVTIEELIDEVGNDAARFFFLMFSHDRHMNFDMELAKEQSDKNPVYYVQYAHARICSLLAEVEKAGAPEERRIVVEDPAEKNLVKVLLGFPELLQRIAHNYEVHHMAGFAVDVARSFHQFYNSCRVIDNGVVNGSRYWLARAAQQVLQQTLAIMGISAPKKM